MLYRNMLKGGSFSEWYRILRNVLKEEKRSYVLEISIPYFPLNDGSKILWRRHIEDSNEASFFMLSTMCDELRRELEYHSAYDMAHELKKRFHQNRSKHLNVLKSLTSDMEIRTGMNSHFSKMMKLIDSLKDLGSPINQDMAIDFILMSLLVEYKEFVDYYKHIFKSDGNCHYFGELGHWKCNCPTYLVRKTKALEAGSSGIFIIEIFSLSSKYWVFDTGCGYHICNDLQGLKKVRRLKQGDWELHVGNGQKVVVKAVGEYTLLLPSGLELVLNNVYFIPNLTRNIVSVSALREQGFNYAFDNDFIPAYLNGLFYFSTKPHIGIYEIEVHDNNVIFNISSKRTKYDFNDTYL
ncbi:hypothetical protein L1987_57973 [Smallanthus sonchifolius]|uniref:Uncharacterized protein n=1 Tax=Smallanthus sonchifolius TaxID=185202 RepID=A0ACB9DE81_9ASTR|nr:hypothetical protein L1987_57973 [Smallanthus sonchifolius]